MRLTHDVQEAASGDSASVPAIFHGLVLDDQSRCVHYGTPLDVVAIKFKCCQRYYACHRCHEEQESHTALVWDMSEFHYTAVLCGVCHHGLTIRQYLDCGFTCPSCGADFNPGCAHHYNLYFAIGAEVYPRRTSYLL